MGLDVGRLLDEALRMAHACGPSVPIAENPGVLLGAVMGEMARVGRDKPTFLLSRDMAVFGLWLEQLVAESTGKEGRDCFRWPASRRVTPPYTATTGSSSTST